MSGIDVGEGYGAGDSQSSGGGGGSAKALSAIGIGDGVIHDLNSENEIGLRSVLANEAPAGWVGEAYAADDVVSGYERSTFETGLIDADGHAQIMSAGDPIYWDLANRKVVGALGAGKLRCGKALADGSYLFPYKASSDTDLNGAGTTNPGGNRFNLGNDSWSGKTIRGNNTPNTVRTINFPDPNGQAIQRTPGQTRFGIRINSGGGTTRLASTGAWKIRANSGSASVASVDFAPKAYDYVIIVTYQNAAQPGDRYWYVTNDEGWKSMVFTNIDEFQGQTEVFTPTKDNIYAAVADIFLGSVTKSALNKTITADGTPTKVLSGAGQGTINTTMSLQSETLTGEGLSNQDVYAIIARDGDDAAFVGTFLGSEFSGLPLTATLAAPSATNSMNWVFKLGDTERTLYLSRHNQAGDVNRVLFALDTQKSLYTAIIKI